MLDVSSLEEYSSDKILGYSQAIKLIQKLRSENKTVGLCHGGFDLLHPGHIKHFESAKGLCDILVVSVTSDKFVSGRKGSGRPIFTDKLRAYMVANVKCVDFVVISDFERGVEVINLLKPSFYIKGPDFINKTTPGITAEREAIRNTSGEMRYTNDPKLGSTEIMEYIKNNVQAKSILVCIDRDGTLVKNNDFLGKNENWVNEIEFNEDVLSFLSFLQTKYKTTKVVVTNQAGVARRLFNCKRVSEVNQHIASRLLSRGIKIDSWQYCPFVDSLHASKHPEIDWNRDYVQESTKRKPGTGMVLDSLKELNAKISDFDEVLVIGDREEDSGLAKSLKAKFIDAASKKYSDMVKSV